MICGVNRKINSDDLVDAAGVAEVLGLGHRNSVRTYRSRYDDFPAPVWTSDGGRCVLWLRSDVQRWAAGRRS
jgi:predicted DNA-binding transcriptional regulator AlpA